MHPKEIAQSVCTREVEGFSPEEIIRHTANDLTQWVWEFLADDGIDYGYPLDRNLYTRIERAIAQCMWAQHKATDEEIHSRFESPPATLSKATTDV
jgi:hypothetical protein